MSTYEIDGIKYTLDSFEVYYAMHSINQVYSVNRLYWTIGMSTGNHALFLRKLSDKHKCKQITGPYNTREEAENALKE